MLWRLTTCYGEKPIEERDMAVGRIDLLKAYDLVPHNLIMEVLKTVRVPRWVRKAVAKTIPKWTTDILLSNHEGDIITLAISFKKGCSKGTRFRLTFPACAWHHSEWP